jgi:hypothetical protein
MRGRRLPALHVVALLRVSNFGVAQRRPFARRIYSAVPDERRNF